MTFMSSPSGSASSRSCSGSCSASSTRSGRKNKHHLYEKGGILAFLLVAIFIAVGIAILAEYFGTWTIWGQVLFAALALAGFIYAIRGGGVMGVVETIESVDAHGELHPYHGRRSRRRHLRRCGQRDRCRRWRNHRDAGLAVIAPSLLHGLNFIIAAFSPSIHALRLNFLEFFGKFYETGKQQYSPFTKTGGEKSA